MNELETLSYIASQLDAIIWLMVGVILFKIIKLVYDVLNGLFRGV